WHWWATAIAIVFFAFQTLVYPVFVAPLFNRYQPLAEGPVKQEILAMARANGMPADDGYEFDASRQSKRISANVSGMFGTTRISLNDNLLKRVSPAGVKAVMGHELGHYVLDHVYHLTIYFGLVFRSGFVFVRRALERLICGPELLSPRRRPGPKFGTSQIGPRPAPGRPIRMMLSQTRRSPPAAPAPARSAHPRRRAETARSPWDARNTRRVPPRPCECRP